MKTKTFSISEGKVKEKGFKGVLAKRKKKKLDTVLLVIKVQTLSRKLCGP